jgi:hypothetical protein
VSRAVRLTIAGVLLVLAIFAALLASDLRSWHDGISSGDAEYVQNPALARWSTPTILPAGLSRGILAISDQVAFRRAQRTFVPVHLLGNGFDNGYSESRARADLELVLSGLARGGDRVRAAAADNMLGILAYADTQTTGAAQPAPIERAVADFQAAVQLDPGNAAAKYNLEWIQRQLVAHGVRPGNETSAGGAKRGHKGAGGGTPGRGY